MSNPYFRDGQLNRNPRSASTIKTFKHGKGYGYNPKIAKSPEQLKEAKK